MNETRGIEGDYLETRDGLFFDIKGLHHPTERKICFVRFFPDPKGDRAKNNLKYIKIYNLRERYNFLRKEYPQYLFYSKEWDLELQGVKNKDIKKIYTPRTYFVSLSKKSDLLRLEKSSLELCELFMSEGVLPKNSIGISGSPMIGLNKEDSDIDLIIYGTEISKNFQNHLATIFKENNFCREYTLNEYHTHYEWRVGGSNIPFDKFLLCEKRKLHQGMYKGFEFFIRYIKSPEDWKGTYYDYKYENLGRLKLKAKVVESEDSIFTPCSYKISGLKILSSKIKKKSIDLGKINEVSSFRGRFCEHAQKGEEVLIEGKLEKVIFKNESPYYRVLLQNQVSDKMTIID